MALRRVQFNKNGMADTSSMGQNLTTGKIDRPMQVVRSNFNRAVKPLINSRVGAQAVINSEQDASKAEKSLALYRKILGNTQKTLNAKVGMLDAGEQHITALEKAAERVQQIQGRRIENSAEHRFNTGMNQAGVQGVVDAYESSSSFDNL